MKFNSKKINQISLIIIIGLSCNQNTQLKPYSKGITFSTKRYLDTSLVAILPFQPFGKFVFDSSYKADLLTLEDIAQIDSLSNVCINSYNNSLSKDESSFRISSSAYRQYVAAANNKGEKEVWINCFCEINNKEWKKSIVLVMDGGGCYFRFKINLTTKKYFDLSVNGEA